MKQWTRGLSSIVAGILVLAGGIPWQDASQQAKAIDVKQGSLASSVWPKGAALNAMICPQITLCFAVGGNTTGPGQAEKWRGLIAQTGDGGKSWTIQYRDQRSSFSGIACPSTTRCYVTGHYNTYRELQEGGPSSGVGTILLTQDGGRTWQPSSLAFRSTWDSIIDGIACPVVTTCLVPALAIRSSGSLYKPFMLITRDGGTTWSKRRFAVGVSGLHPNIACPTRWICYVKGSTANRMAIVETSDAGKTWRMLPGTDVLASIGVGPDRLYDFASSLACASASVCYTADGYPEGVCGEDCHLTRFGAIFGTRDGFKHWRVLYLRRKHDYLSGPIVCPGANVCYAVGDTNFDVTGDEFILSTKNAGQTWTKHMVRAGPALACASIDICYVALGTTIFRTTDGGKTWQSVG